MNNREKIRSFIAIEIPYDIRMNISNQVKLLSKDDFSVRWVDKDNLHITLLFLGDVDYDFINKGIEILSTITKSQQKFKISLQNFGAFPSIKQPRIIWIGIKDGVNDLITLQSKIENNFVKIGYKSELKKYHPHLTIGRVKFRFTNQKIFETQYQSENFVVESVSLFKSDLTPKGPIYSKINDFVFYE